MTKTLLLNFRTLASVLMLVFLLISSPTRVVAQVDCGTAMSFDGVDDYGDPVNYIPFTGDFFTLDFWVQVPVVGTEGLESGEPVGVIFGNMGSGNGADVYINDSGQISMKWNSGFSWDLHGTRDLRDGAWHHIAVVHAIRSGDLGTVYVYVDNILQIDGNSSAAVTYLPNDLPWTNVNPPLIGANNETNVPYFHGKLDEVRLWQKEMSQEEIRELISFQGFGDQTESDLWMYWDFEEEVGSSRALSNVTGSGRSADLLLMNMDIIHCRVVPVGTLTYEFYLRDIPDLAVGASHEIELSSVLEGDYEFVSSNLDVATIDGTTITAAGVGVVTISVNSPGNCWLGEKETTETFNVANPPANNDCSGAIALEKDVKLSGTTYVADIDLSNISDCKVGLASSIRGVWYTFVGDGSPAVLGGCNVTNIRAYAGSCDAVLECVNSLGADEAYECEGSSSSIVIGTITDIQYYVLVYHEGLSDGEDFEITMSASDALTNDLVENAIDIEIGETVTGNTTFATSDDDVVGNCGGNEIKEDSKGVWYHLVGNGETIFLSTCTGDKYTFDDTSLAVFTGSVADGLSCVTGNEDTGNTEECGSSGYQSALRFNSISGEDYYILVDGYLDDAGEFDLSSYSEPTPEPLTNDFCNTATILRLGESPVAGHNVNAVADSAMTCDEYSTPYDVWYKIPTVSTDEIRINFEPTDPDGEGALEAIEDAYFFLYESCDREPITGSCIYRNTATFSVTPGQDIYIQIWNDPYGSEGSFTIQAEATGHEYNTWDGTAWSFGAEPTEADTAFIAGTYSTLENGIIWVNYLFVTEDGSLDIDGSAEDDYILVLGLNGIVNHGDITLYHDGGFMLTPYGEYAGTNYTIQRLTTFDQSTGRYSMIGSPVQNATFDQLGSNALVYGYDESVPYEEGVTDGLNRFKSPDQLGLSEMQVGKGYFSAFTGDENGLVYFHGTPNKGEILIDLDFTDQDNESDNAFSGYHILANPYIIPLSIGGFLEANTGLEGAIYVWDDNGSDSERGSNADFIVHNGEVAVSTTPGGRSEELTYISTGQGFFAKVSDTNGTTVRFIDSPEMLSDTPSNSTFFRTSQSKSSTPIVRINLSNTDGLFRQTVIGIKEGIDMNSVDRAFDARVFNSSAADMIYTNKGNSRLAIQGIGEETSEVALGVNVEAAGIYSIELGEDLIDNKEIYLLDKKTGVVTNLSEISYSFNSQAGEIENRFTLIFHSTSTVLGETLGDATVYAYQKTIYIKSLEANQAVYRLYDLLGNQLFSGQFSGPIELDFNYLKDGVYIISNGTESKKLLLK